MKSVRIIVKKTQGRACSPADARRSRPAFLRDHHKHGHVIGDADHLDAWVRAVRDHAVQGRCALRPPSAQAAHAPPMAAGELRVLVVAAVNMGLNGHPRRCGLSCCATMPERQRDAQWHT